MKSNEVAFIICADNAQYYSECVRYIHELEIPDNFTIDIMCIQEADSIIEGYRAGMLESDAKYKVYVRQDVLILNQHFISEIIDIFQKNPKIGLIGMVGCGSLPEDADYYNSWDIGSMEIFNGRALEDNFNLRQPAHAYETVKAVQGTILATQYDLDVKWEEKKESEQWKNNEGGGFYDLALSMEMLRHGYEIAVPRQETPWCYCLNGNYDLRNYDKYRLQMIQEFPDFFKYKEKTEIILQRARQAEKLAKIREDMMRLMKEGQYEILMQLADEIRLNSFSDSTIQEIANMMEIYFLEEMSNICDSHSEWFAFHNWEQIYESYLWIRLVLIRMAYGREDERVGQLKQKILAGAISKDAVRKIFSISLRNSNETDDLPEVKAEQPLVSVVTLVHNGEDTIGEAIESVLHQSYKNIEFIIIDDASFDHSKDIICKYKDPRIKTIFLEKNHNVCDAGNIGFEHTKGKYIAFIGHDDLWRKDKLEKQVSFLEEHPSYTACFTWLDMIDEKGQINNINNLQLYQTFCADNLQQGECISKMLQSGNYVCAPSACVRADMIHKVGGYRYGLLQLQDYDLWLRFLVEGPIYILQEKLTFYRRFSKDANKENLSGHSAEMMNRMYHENQWVNYNFLESMEEESFRTLLRKYLRNADAKGKKEIMCEKAFKLWELENCFAVKLFIELLEDEEARTILKTKYQLELNDFYKMNAKPLFFDPGYAVTCSS